MAVTNRRLYIMGCRALGKNPCYPVNLESDEVAQSQMGQKIFLVQLRLLSLGVAEVQAAPRKTPSPLLNCLCIGQRICPSGTAQEKGKEGIKYTQRRKKKKKKKKA